MVEEARRAGIEGRVVLDSPRAHPCFPRWVPWQAANYWAGDNVADESGLWDDLDPGEGSSVSGTVEGWLW